jgi:DNA-binding NarL/FixJ family response regulator
MCNDVPCRIGRGSFVRCLIPTTISVPPQPSLYEPTSALSAREQEVVAPLAGGLTNRQIAAELVIAERTASTHVAHIVSKLNFSTRIQIATWATEQGRTRRQRRLGRIEILAHSEGTRDTHHKYAI